MDTHALFQKYLDTKWPDVWITWPRDGQEKMRNFFYDDTSKILFDDLLDYVKEEIEKETPGTGARKILFTLSCSDWLMRYFRTVRGRALAKKHLNYHEPLMISTVTRIDPLSVHLNGFFEYVISDVWMLQP